MTHFPYTATDNVYGKSGKF